MVYGVTPGGANRQAWFGKFAKSVHRGSYDEAMSYQPQFDWKSWDLTSLTGIDEPPPSVRNAVRLMYAGAAIEAVNAIVLIAFIHSLFLRFVFQYQGMLARFPQLGPIFATAHMSEATVVGTVVVFAAIRIGMWLWMANKNRAGRNWARILSAVFLGLATPAVIVDLARRGQTDGLKLHGVISLAILEVAIWLVGVCAIALLCRRESSEFFTARSTRR
jgi:hypothetical protein